MLRLIIRETGLERLVEIALDRVTIGRSKANTLLVNDAKASPEHCLLKRTSRGWLLVDCQSKRGTYLDGSRVRTAPVSAGSVISIGKTRILIEHVDEVKTEPEEFKPPGKRSRMRKALPVLASCAACLATLYLAAHAIFLSISHEQPAPVVRQRAFHEEPWERGRGPRWPYPPRTERIVIEPDPPVLDGEFEPVIRVPRGTSFDNLGGRDSLTETEILARLGVVMPTDRRICQPLAMPRIGTWLGRRHRMPESVELAISAALDWLARHQDPDGRWDQDQFHKNCKTVKNNACDGRGTSQYDVGVTSLALLAFMGAGSTHKTGLHRSHVGAGVKWLRRQQDEDGAFGKDTGTQSWVYNHAIATTALCEAYAMTRDYRLKKPCRKAVEFILRARNPGEGWKYKSRGGKSDTSVTGWMVMALNAAKHADIEVPQSALDGALAWFNRMTDGKGKVGYMSAGDDGSYIKGSSERYANLPTMTAEATICRILCGVRRMDPKILKGVDIMMNNLPQWNEPNCDKIDMYYWFWATYAMYQYGGQRWHKWQHALKKALTDSQCLGGCVHGSWDPVGKWGMVGGRVYATAINALTLEIYYRYLRANPMPHRTRDMLKGKGR